MTTNRKRKHRITIILILSSFLAAHLCFWLLPNLFEIWNSQAVDQFFVLRSSSERLRLPYDKTVAHVDLNNSSIRRLEDLYLNRSHFAQATRNLSAMHVSAQVYDFIFAARLDEKTDRALIEATRQAGNVYFGLAFELREGRHLEKIREKEEEQMPHLERTKWDVRVDGDVGSFYVGREPLCTFPELASVSGGLGSMSIKFDRDGVLRRVPLILRYSGGFYPILPFRVVCDYLRVPPENVLVKPGKSIILKDARIPSQKDPRDIMIPIDHQGNMIVNYIGPWGQMDHYSFADILLASNDRIELEMWRDELKGKIVVISDVSTGSTDVGPVPTDSNFPLSGVHANVIHGILTESFLRELSHTEGLLIEVLILATIFFLSVRFTSIYFLLSMPLVIGFYLGTVSLGFFYGHLVFPLVRPILMVVFAVVSVVVYRYIHEEKEKMESLRQRDFVRETFGRYLSNEVVEELLESPGGLEMGGENREVTFLVSDLRGFMGLSGRLSPQEVINILNRYLERMVAIIGCYRGTVNEIEGDGILAFFGAPIAGSDDAHRAVACAIEMQRDMVEINAQQRRLGLPELAMGIGINTGEVVVGNIGSSKRAKYGAIGSPINEAYRVESFTVEGQILISLATYERVKSVVQIQGSTEVQFKGLERPVILYDVVGMGGPYQIALPEKKASPLHGLEPPIPITCFPLEGKRVSETSIPGHITHIAESSAQIFVDQRMELGSNLKILIAAKEASGLPGIYAKVMSVETYKAESSKSLAHLEFTWLPEDVKEFLQSFSSKPMTL